LSLAVKYIYTIWFVEKVGKGKQLISDNQHNKVGVSYALLGLWLVNEGNYLWVSSGNLQK
jgi:hypothetical protein